MSYDFFILSTEDSVSFPSGSTRYWPIASNLKLYCFKLVLFIYFGMCCVFIALQAVLCGERGPLYGCVSGLLIAVVPLGSMGTGACRLQWLLGVGSTLAVARI